MIEVDVRGLSCPIPVLKTKEAMDDNPEAEIRVFGDTEASKENVSRLARSRGYEVAEEKLGDGYLLTLRPRLP